MSFRGYRIPGIINAQFIRVEMMIVVENPPTMEGINQGQESNMTHQIIDPTTFRKGAMATVMANNKPTRQSRSRKNPGHRQTIPR